MWHVGLMSRTRKAYRSKFRIQLARFGARKLEKGREWLDAKVERLCAAQQVSLDQALSRVDQTLQLKLRRWRRNRARRGLVGPSANRPPSFLCDASLGGLARWLRAAG